VLTTQGIGESKMVERLEAEKFQCPEISIGFYPGLGRVEIRLTAPVEKRDALDEAERILRTLLSDYLI
jgi:molybdopterin-biosynthesis enzyme MoeA-like protein